MTLRLSTATRNLLAQGMGFGAIFNRGSIEIYSGAQPVSADAAITGTLLGIVTSSSGALTKEVAATGTIVITGAASGAVNTITVGGLNIIPDGAVNAVAGDTAGTASALCDAINRNGIMVATVSGSTVTIKGRPGAGVNTAAVTGTLTTVTATYGTGAMAGGTAPVNGLYLGTPVAGVTSKPSSQVWSFNGVAAGTAGWFRFVASAADGGALQTVAPFLARLDGSIATSGADLNMSNIVVAVAAPNTIDTFNLTIPAQ